MMKLGIHVFIANIKQHFGKTIHKGVNYSCEFCEYKASVKSNLKTHVESIHNGFRYSCNKYEYKASQRHSLSTHINRHHMSV